MPQIKIEKRTRIRNNISYPEYCIYSASGKKGLLHVSPIKDIFMTCPECKQDHYMHVHNFYQIVWTKKGKGLHYVDAEEHKVCNDSIFLLSPHNAHHYQPTSLQDGYSIAFTPDFLEHIDPTAVDAMRNMLFKRNGASICHVPKPTSRKLYAIISQMETEQNDHKLCHMSNTFQSSLLMLLITIIQRECIWPVRTEKVKHSHSYRIYNSFLNEVEQKFMELHAAKDYAKLLGISVSLLGRYTKEHGQCTPLDIITNRIVTEAKRMLRYTPLHIKEVAHALGFKDPSYFHKFFKRYVGLLPSEFRG